MNYSFFCVRESRSRKFTDPCSSDHVHYYHGGAPFEYVLVDPSKPVLRRVVLGPDIAAGQVLQLPVRGGTWKAGRLLFSAGHSSHDYCLIGEAVGPAFDFHDFSFLSAADVAASIPELSRVLAPFVHGAVPGMNIDESFDEYYNDDSTRKARADQRN